MPGSRPLRPTSRAGFEIAIYCALPIEAEAVEATFDHDWDLDSTNHVPFEKLPGDPNAYSTGTLGRHNVVLVYPAGVGKANAASSARAFRISFPNIKLALLVGICGIVPDTAATMGCILGDAVISTGIIQLDFGRTMPSGFQRKDTLDDNLGRAPPEIRSFLNQLQTRKWRNVLAQETARHLRDLQQHNPEYVYPGAQHDRCFHPGVVHSDDQKSCAECRCEGEQSQRSRLDALDIVPALHFGKFGSGDQVMRDAVVRDTIAQRENIIAFEMEGAGLWDAFPSVVIKSASDYADSHKSDDWRSYAAATAAACAKAFLSRWTHAPTLQATQPLRHLPASFFVVRYTRNAKFSGRETTMKQLHEALLPKTPGTQARVALCGLGGVGKTQIAIEFAYRVSYMPAAVSVFWVQANSREHFRKSYLRIGLECRIFERDETNIDILAVTKEWLERKDVGFWLMIVDNADDVDYLEGEQGIGRHLPECSHGSILTTTRNGEAGLRVVRGSGAVLNVDQMSNEESAHLLEDLLEKKLKPQDVHELADRLDHLPLALAQAAAFMQSRHISVPQYLALLSQDVRNLAGLLGQNFDSDGWDYDRTRAVTETWIVTLDQIKRQNTLAVALLSPIGAVSRQSIPTDMLQDYAKRWHQATDLQFIDAMGLLQNFSFLTRAADDSWDMHRLVQQVTRSWLGHQAEDTLTMAVFQTSLTLFQLWPRASEMFDPSVWPKCWSYLPHTCLVLLLCFDPVSSVPLEGKVLEFMICQNVLEDAEEYLHKKLHMCTTRLGDGDPLVSLTTARLNRVKALRGQRDRLAAPLAPPVGAKHPELQRQSNTMEYHSVLVAASCLITQQKWSEAIQLLKPSAACFDMDKGPENSLHVTALEVIASCHAELKQWPEFYECISIVLDARSRFLGSEHPYTLRCLQVLCASFEMRGKYQQAVFLATRLLDHERRHNGERHLGTIKSTLHLAVIQLIRGRITVGRELSIRALNSAEAILDKAHPARLQSLLLVATLHQRGKDVSKAIGMLQELIEAESSSTAAKTLTPIAIEVLWYFSKGRAPKLDSHLRELLRQFQA